MGTDLRLGESHTAHMLNFGREKLIDMSDAAARIGRPKRTLLRWATEGVRHGTVRLEVLVQGRLLRTSVEALERFFAAAAQARNQSYSLIRPRTERQRQKDLAAVNKRLAAKGVLRIAN